jgi:hypothetical protein
VLQVGDGGGGGRHRDAVGAVAAADAEDHGGVALGAWFGSVVCFGWGRLVDAYRRAGDEEESNPGRGRRRGE